MERARSDVIEAMARIIFKTVEPVFAEDGCEPNDTDYIAALSAALHCAEGLGYVLAPITPTREMVVAGGDATFDVYMGYNEETRRHMRMMDRACEHRAMRAYAAMMKAATEQPTVSSTAASSPSLSQEKEP